MSTLVLGAIVVVMFTIAVVLSIAGPDDHPLRDNHDDYEEHPE